MVQAERFGELAAVEDVTFALHAREVERVIAIVAVSHVCEWGRWRVRGGAQCEAK